jgi:hypothetical protein
MAPVIDCAFFAFTNADRWEAGIGDPTVLGWCTVAAYFAASLVCWLNAFSKASTRFERLFWMCFGFGLIVLGINKQLDLQTWFTLTAKSFAKQTGWYDERRIVQAVFVVAIALLGGGFLAALWSVVRRAAPPYRIAVAGAVFLVCFIVVRAASFHHFEEVLGWHVGQLRVNHVLELGGIGCIAAGAVQAYRTRRKLLGPSGPEQFQWRHCES